MQNATATSIAGQTPSAQNGHAHAHTTPTFSCLPHQRNNVATILGKLLLACAPLADGQTEPQLLLKAAPPPPFPCSPPLAALLAVICLSSPPVLLASPYTQLNSSSSSRNAITSEMQKCVPKYLTDTQIL